MTNELGMIVPSGTDIRSTGALRGGEGSVAERPRSGLLFSILPFNGWVNVGVTGMVMVRERDWGCSVSRTAGLPEEHRYGRRDHVHLLQLAHHWHRQNSGASGLRWP